MKEYLNDKLADFKKYYDVHHYLSTYCNCDRDMKRQWKQDFDKIKLQWENIKSVSDVQEYVDRYVSTIERCNDANGIFIEAYDMNLALYRAIKAIEKMAYCYDMDRFDFHKFTKEEADNLFSELYKWTKEMRDIAFRRSVRD